VIRKLALAALIATGTLGGLASTASAQPPVIADRHDHDHDKDRGHGRGVYKVLVRHRGHWDEYRTVRDRDDAYRLERQLERRGYDARVERVRGR
jgi:hypothetical protein